MQKYFFGLILLISLYSCSTDQPLDSNHNLIPVPSEINVSPEFSILSTLVFEKNSDLRTFAPWITSWQNSSISNSGNVSLVIDDSISDGGYAIEVVENKAALMYKTKEGLKNGLSTLFQLWEMNNGRLPLLKISDNRPFSYRGMHLDVGRHMFPIQDIKKYIDFLAFYKFNYFHWHLTEDQGWRIEIMEYPKLQSIAAYRKETLVGHYGDQPHQFDGRKYGGYYTQDEIREVVAYAHIRGIEVIPEIDIPGHSLALLAAYPELGCEIKKYETGTKWGVFEDVLCPTETTFTFLKNVFNEIIPLFPSEYIHIGGDECPKTAWKKSEYCQELIKKENLKDEHGLQSYFIQRIEKFLNSKGKKIIGWDEILEGGLAPNATVMSWRGNEGGITAANHGHNAIMTPTSHCYFDYYQAEGDHEPLAIGGYLPISKVYNWNPIPDELPTEKQKFILGGQGNVWTEYMKTFKQVEYMSLARMATLSEVLWGKNSNTIQNFGGKLLEHVKYWKSKNVNIANHLLEPKVSASVTQDKGPQVEVENLVPNITNYIKTPNNKSWTFLKNKSYPLNKSGTYQVKSKLEGDSSRIYSVNYSKHLANNAMIEFKNEPSEKYQGSGPSCVINGIEGSNDKYGGLEWLGFSGDDVDALLTFKNETKISSVRIKTFDGKGQWIYPPKSISIFSIEEDGSKQLLMNSEEISTKGKIASTTLSFTPVDLKKMQVIIENYGEIPEGKQGAGHKSWLFIDELIVY